MQVVFSVPFRDGDCSARVWHLPSSEVPLVVRLLDRLRVRPSMSPDVVYEGLVTVQTTVTVPCDGELARRMQAIDDISVPLPRDYVMAVHAMSYQLEIRKGAARLRFQTHAGAMDEFYDDPLLSWMAFIGRSFRDAVRQNPPVTR